MAQDKPQPETAFMAAALALLVLPVLVMFGLSALGLAAGFFAPMDRMTDGSALWLVLALFALWIILVVAIVLMLVARLMRRSARS